jgi:hypothetical protein
VVRNDVEKQLEENVEERVLCNKRVSLQRWESAKYFFLVSSTVVSSKH